MPRRHLKKDERTTQCGLTLTPKFAKQLAPDRQHVTCGACELTTRPKTAPPPKVDPEFAGVSRPGRATGATWLGITRRSSRST